MKKFLVALVIAAIASGACARAAAPIQVVDLMPSFFRSNTSGATIVQRVERFKENVLYPSRSLYNQRYFALDDPHLAWYLDTVSPKLDAVRSFHETIVQSLPRGETVFEAAFPKFDPSAVTVYLIPSMGVFDGMTEEIAGRHALLIGVDAFAQEHFPLFVFMDHEMFHIYHHQVNPAFFQTPSENDLYRYGLYRQLWAEGLATFVSQQLNPGASKADALASNDLANLSQPQTQQLACLVAQDFDSTSASDSGLFFLGDRHPADLPSRGGYYIGYLAAKRLAQTYSLAQLAELSGDALHDKVLDATKQLCARAKTD